MRHEMAQGSLDSDRLSSAGLSSHSSGTAANGGEASIVGGEVGGGKGQDDDYSLGPLPPMWEKAYTATGEAYFIDHNSNTSHWLDPRLARVRKRSLGDCAEDELPFGWERVTDDRYGAYYVDHINRRTQYENPVLQATRLRAEKMQKSLENGGAEGAVGGGGAGSELRGEKFSLTLTKGPQGLGFTLIGGADVEGGRETEGYLQIRSIVPHSPAWIDGALRPGDVLSGVGGRGVRGATHAQVAQLFQSIPSGSRVTLQLCRGYPLAFDTEDPHTRVLSTLAVDAASPALAPTAAGGPHPGPHDAIAMQHLTHALRTRFNLESPGERNGGRDEVDRSPARSHSPAQRRIMSRSFDLDELGETEAASPMPPRCPSADHLLTLSTDVDGGADGGGAGGGAGEEAGRELLLTLRRGAAGFGFTIADSVHGQKVKKVLDRSRCAGLREGDLLLQIGDTDVRHAPHLRVVQVLKECPALHETSLRVWRRAAPAPAPTAPSTRAPRSRSATRPHVAQQGGAMIGQLGRSKTPTAEQLRSPTLHPVDPLHGRLNGEATYAVPEHKRESLMDRRRRSSTPGGRLSMPTVAPWTDNHNPAPWPGNQAPVAPWPDHDDQPIPSLDRPHPNPDRLHLNPGFNADRLQLNTDRLQLNTDRLQLNADQLQLNPDRMQLNADRINMNVDRLQMNQSQSDRSQQGEWPETWLDNSTNVRNWAENSRKWDNNSTRNWELSQCRWSGQEPWCEVGTPTVRVDTDNYWRGNTSVADSSDNGGFAEEGAMACPATAAVGGQAQDNATRMRPLSPSNNSTGRMRSHSPSNNSSSGRLLAHSPARSAHSPGSGAARLRQHSPAGRAHRSPSCFNCHAGGGTDSPLARALYPDNYPQVESGGGVDPEADVLVRLAPGAAGFGFRIVGGTEDGSRVAVGHVVPGGPADGLLRPGDLLTSVDGAALSGATHARAVAAVFQAAARGHVTLGVRHNRADVQSLGLAGAGAVPAVALHSNAHQPAMVGESGHGYNIVHPAPLYPPPHQHQHPHHAPHMYGSNGSAWQYESGGGAAVPYDVTVTRNEGEGFGFVVISSTNKATSTIGQLIANSPAAACGLLRVGDTILAINHAPIHHLPHPDVVALIKQSGRAVTLTVQPAD